MAAWQEAWLATAGPARRDLWRGVEAQHQVATMRLVDNLHDQALLEQLLEGSKPPLPPGCANLHYLLTTPFRYASPWPSRFRSADAPGVWYGADEPATVAAELAHWRWRFLLDSDGLRDEELVTEHTFFLAQFRGLELDLTVGPWVQARATWRNPEDYAACQALAASVRTLDKPVAAIRYESARREGGHCEAVFAPQSLGLPELHRQQTWVCKTNATLVLLAHQGEIMEFRRAGGGREPGQAPGQP